MFGADSVKSMSKAEKSDARLDWMADRSAADAERYGITGTPSFVMNGALLDGVHNWAALRPVLDKQR